ncbi:polysaccharide deacetylase family protein [Desulfobulbus rhabdoformis]|uniref:polysaccharide deacetylase family protein n=1 Tax=Desulfobulbus rhabdoformis TaxID=34032 RepID=UPI0019643FD2|nr:polysaccharide deacetylase family protein [Desulfobulbus rhabdoformis]MBM9616715.1 polysaccharide deacetylase family protein [Desulfobulbus rhabdoformis]
MPNVASLKKWVRASSVSRAFLQVFLPDTPRIFVYHRFSKPNEGWKHRVDQDTFKWQLEQLVKKFTVLTLKECLEHYHKNGQWPPRCVVLTIDDGYRDFYHFAYPALHSLGLKATFFVTTAFIDKNIWLWPDRLDYALRNTIKTELVVELGKGLKKFPLVTELDIFNTWKILSDYCISIHNIDKWHFIDIVEKYLNVFVPETPTKAYAAVTWDELQEMAKNGIEIGSHTVNHHLLSKIDLQESRKEIVESKLVLEKKLGQPVQTFCYPNSAPGDITDAVVREVKDAGYIGAVFGTNLTRWTPYEIPRMGVSNDRDDFLAKLAGLEFAGMKLREALQRGRF